MFSKLPLLLLLSLAGCAGGNFWDDWFGAAEQARAAHQAAHPYPERWCYHSIGAPMCYDHPLPEAEGRLIAADRAPAIRIPAEPAPPQAPVAAALPMPLPAPAPAPVPDEKNKAAENPAPIQNSQPKESSGKPSGPKPLAPVAKSESGA